jgi:hypothetical protein
LIVVGENLQDAAAGVTFTNASVSSNRALVNIQFTPTLAVVSNQQNYIPGKQFQLQPRSTFTRPIAKAIVNFTITKANEAVVTGKATITVTELRPSV